MSADIDRRLLQLENSQAPAVDRLFDAYEELYKYSLGEEDEIARRFVVKAAIKVRMSRYTYQHVFKFSDRRKPFMGFSVSLELVGLLPSAGHQDSC